LIFVVVYSPHESQGNIQSVLLQQQPTVTPTHHHSPTAGSIRQQNPVRRAYSVDGRYL